jgi:hypothetical protein
LATAVLGYFKSYENKVGTNVLDVFIARFVNGVEQ